METEEKNYHSALALYKYAHGEISRYRDREWANTSLFTASIVAVDGFIISYPQIAQQYTLLFYAVLGFLALGNIYYSFFAHHRLTRWRNVLDRTQYFLGFNKIFVDGHPILPFEVKSPTDKNFYHGWRRGLYSHLVPFSIAGLLLSFFGAYQLHQALPPVGSTTASVAAVGLRQTIAAVDSGYTHIAHPNTPDFTSLLRDILIAYAWPFTILIIVCAFFRPLSSLLRLMGEFLKNADEVVFGKWKVRTKEGRTTTSSPGPPSAPASASELTPPVALGNEMARRILSTMWYYQKSMKDPTQRWTFTLSAFHPDYPLFVASMRDLATRGMVAQDQKSGQFFLTDIGMFFCAQNENDLNAEKFTFA